MAIDTREPRDETPVSSLPFWIRDTRMAIFSDGITGATFEVDTEEGDAVYLDTGVGVWRRSRVGAGPDRARFHGIADPQNGVVKIFGFRRVATWNWEPDQLVYVSDVEFGKLQQSPPTEIIAGLAVTVDSILIDSQISGTLDGLRQEVFTARQGKASLVINLSDMQAAHTTLSQEVVAGRKGQATLVAQLDSMISAYTAFYNQLVQVDQGIQAELTSARMGQPSLADQIAAMVTARNQLALEVTDARGAEESLGARIGALQNFMEASQQEVVTARGTAVNLGNRLNVSLNPDGTLKTTVSTSMWSVEEDSFAFTNSTTITVSPGNKTGVYVANRALRLNGSTVVHVVSSTFNAEPNTTTVTIAGGVVPNPLTTLEFSFHPDQLPLYSHAALSNILGAVLSDTNAVQNKHVSNANAKNWEDHRLANAPHAGHETPSGAQAKVDTHAALASPHSGHATVTNLDNHVNAASPHSGHATTAALTTHTSAASPHSGHATTTDLTNHTNLTNPHSATSAATADRLVLRDANGRAKVAAPFAADDIAIKDTVDTHANLTNPHSATAAATANRLIIRDAAGRAKVAAPSAADDIARKDTVDAVQTNLNTHTDAAAPHSGHATTTALNNHTSAAAPHTGHLQLNPPTQDGQMVMSQVVCRKDAQEGWNSTGVISWSNTGNPGLALWSDGASGIWLRHIRNSRRLFVLDDQGAPANISANAAVDASDVVTLGQLTTAAIGINQTWQDVLSSRSAGVNYQNTTGRPIQVSVNRYSSGSWEVFCGASTSSMVSLARFETRDNARPIIAGYSFIVPNGWFYRLDVSGADDVYSRRWVELR